MQDATRKIDGNETLTVALTPGSRLSRTGGDVVRPGARSAKVRFFVAVAVVGGVFLSGGVTRLARAGARADIQVTVLSNGFSGVLSSARNSADAVQYIGCEIYKSGSGSPVTALCYAREASGAYASCSTTDGGLIQVLSTLKSDDYLVVYVSGSSCVSANHYTASFYPPKAP